MGTQVSSRKVLPWPCWNGRYGQAGRAAYGYGGFIGVDGVSHSAGDIWGHVFANDVAIAEGDHYWEALGFEGCCDGHSELEVHLPADNVADPWRQIVSGASDELVGDCTGEPKACDGDGSDSDGELACLSLLSPVSMVSRGSVHLGLGLLLSVQLGLGLLFRRRDLRRLPGLSC